MSHPCILLSSLALLLLSCPVRSSPAQFTIDESQSEITLSGNVLGNPLREQGPGSLVTSFSGTIFADLSPSTIRFPGGSTLTAKTNGVWQPGPNGGSDAAPADYAAQASTFLVSIKGALRNLVLDLTSSVLPVTGGRFDAAELVIGFPENSVASFDYAAGFLGSDGIALSGLSTNRLLNAASLSTTGGVQTLSIDIDTEFQFSAVLENDSLVRFTGTLVASRLILPAITAIELNGQTVTLRVEGTGAEPRLDSSSDLGSWTTRTPNVSNDAEGLILTLPAGGPQEFYRVAK